MNIIPFSPESVGRFRDSLAEGLALSERYSSDPDFRSRIEAGDVAEPLEALGIKPPEGVAAKIVVNTPDTFHLVMPADPNAELGEDVLSMIGGGKTAGSAGSAGSASTASTAFSCISTASSAGSVGTAGTGS